MPTISNEEKLLAELNEKLDVPHQGRKYSGGGRQNYHGTRPPPKNGGR